MDIRLISGSCKSLTEFVWQDIPKFAVVTGPNGSGKTQMLEFIAQAAGLEITPEGMEERTSYLDPPPPFQAHVELSHNLSSQNVVFRRSGWPTVRSYSRSIFELAEEAWRWESDQNWGLGWGRLWSLIEEKIGKPRSDILKDEFLYALPPNFPLLSDVGLSQGELEVLFISYLHRIELLQQANHTPEEITAELGPLPWDVLNDILASAALPYCIVTPTLPRPQPYQKMVISYTLALQERTTGQYINPSDLSSGEKVMFTVALWFFSFSQRQEANISDDISRLLLLDEPDAHLHPALTRTFLHVIHSELVEKHSVRVIMTTHSPSTVALAPDNSIFVMSREAPRIQRAPSKWRAVGQLTSGFLTIGSESKCVFVEGEPDREFYTTLQALLKEPNARPQVLDTSKSILFIPANAGDPDGGNETPSGGKNNVEKWVEAIPSTQIAGIIDRDKGNPGGARIHVLRRYNLECYLLDPLFIFAVLLEHKKAPPVSGITLGVHDARRLLTQNQNTLQAIVEVMLTEMRSLLSSPPAAVDRLPVRYFNGPEVFLERWFIESSAKPLLESLKNRFGLAWLNNRHELTTQYHVMEIVPTELVEMLLAIQAA